MALANDRVVVVTGASRGAGKGIALALGATGATVYVTGRSNKAGEGVLGTVGATAEEVTAAGGKGIAVVCDHSDDAQVKALFDQVKKEQGHLDILVNNATMIHPELSKKGPFWEKSLDLVGILDVGLRSHYTATYYAAPLLVASGGGLVVNTSSPGGRCYMHGPAYGSGKAGADKMARDFAHDFRPFNIAAVSIWMGILLTEQIQAAADADPEGMKDFVAMAETPQFTGMIIDALANDAKLMERSGKTFYGSELGTEYGIEDLNGQQPASHRGWLGAPPEFSEAVVE
ncbi:SDR family NAD(P)-dependent oxidoreductase [Halieaceae bacterium]|nr:SDR family NAD(P)-dependent oxidoreductase [Halieaceae bacterium]